MVDDDRFGCGYMVQGFEAFFTTKSALFHASEGQFNPAAGAVAVDEDLSGPDAFDHAVSATVIAGPHRGHQSVGYVVSQMQRLGFIAEGITTSTGPNTSFWATSWLLSIAPSSVGG